MGFNLKNYKLIRQNRDLALWCQLGRSETSYPLGACDSAIEILENLSPFRKKETRQKEIRVFRELFVEGNDLQTVALQLNLSKERIRQIIAKALRIIQSPNYSDCFSKTIISGDGFISMKASQLSSTGLIRRDAATALGNDVYEPIDAAHPVNLYGKGFIDDVLKYISNHPDFNDNEYKVIEYRYSFYLIKKEIAFKLGLQPYEINKILLNCIQKLRTRKSDILVGDETQPSPKKKEVEDEQQEEDEQAEKQEQVHFNKIPTKKNIKERLIIINLLKDKKNEPIRKELQKLLKDLTESEV